MIRGTTPKIEAVLPFDTDTIAEVFLTLSQRGRIVVDKGMDQCTVEERKLSWKLTQAETLALDEKVNVEIQIRLLTAAGDSLASKIYCTDVGKILKDGEI